MPVSGLRRIGYTVHTRSTRRIVVEAQLRHDWDLLRMLPGVLVKNEREGGPAPIRMLPGEHCFLAKLAVRVAERARQLIADEADSWAGDARVPEAERAAREEWIRTARKAEAGAEWPAWHRDAVQAIDAMAVDEALRVRASDRGMFDRAAQAYRAEVGGGSHGGAG